MTCVVGTNKLDKENQTTYKVDYFKTHQNYTREDFDIGLVHVVKPIEFSDKINKISLQTEPFNEENAKAILTGWGYTDIDTKVS